MASRGQSSGGILSSLRDVGEEARYISPRHRALVMERTLGSLDRKFEEAAAKRRASSIKWRHVNLYGYQIEPSILGLLPRDVSERAGIIIFAKTGRNVSVGVLDPTNPEVQKVLRDLELIQGYNVQRFLISKTSYSNAAKIYDFVHQPRSKVTRTIHLPREALDRFEREIGTLGELDKRIKELPTTQILSTILAGAIKSGASDIHLEPREKQIQLRYRIDGVLHDVASFPRESYNLILSRVKLVAEVKLNVHETAQDGRFTIIVAKKDKIEVRTSILPGAFGENIVLRLLAQKATSLKLSDLGLRGKAKEVMSKQIARPNGMIITTGPTGSGKTTTLYACLNKVNAEEIKIITLEDPIEYHLDGIEQTQVNEDEEYTFANGLRAILRQDPDVLMVGEIRDVETAEIAVHAALTGHLVFSTLHTNDAPGAIPRLIDMGVKPDIMPAALNAVIAQRLVRKLCPKCKERYTPDADALDRVRKVLATVSPKAKIKFDPKKKIFYKAKGCKDCAGLGYKGRIGLFEIFAIDSPMTKLITEGANITQVREGALEAGMVTILQDGVLRALEGITSIEEVERVAGEGAEQQELYDKILAQTLMRGIKLTSKEVAEYNQKVKTVTQVASTFERITTDEAVKLIALGALRTGATDIHLEPQEKDARVRYRIDSTLHDAAILPKEMYPQILAEIKLLAGLPTNIHEAAKDARFSIIIDDKPMDTRVSIILGAYGETVVIRILPTQAKSLDLKKLGFSTEQYNVLLKEIRKPNGLILNTGPTSSGKTTTLNAILNILNTGKTKIITVEDPIEYRVEGVIQSQVDEEKDYTFPIALRSLLRQNPNIMMIGEIRDAETAQIAIQASLTGHLVLSTLHTNNAAGSVARLSEFGVDPSSIANTMNAFIAQRLVRLLCPKCKKAYAPTSKERDRIKDVFKRASAATKKRLGSKYQLYKSPGCSACAGLGYKGQLAIVEIITKNDDIEQAILRGGTTTEIDRLAQRHGTITMAQDGVLKAIQGITSLEEVERVTIA